MAKTEIKGGIKITDISRIDDQDITGQDYTVIVDHETQKTKTITLDKLASFSTTGPFGPNYSVLFNTGSQIYGSSNFIWNYDTNKLGINKIDPAYEIDVDGDIRISGEVIADKVTAREYHTELVSASVIYESGSTKFGDDALDIHQMTGSLHIYGAGSLLNLRTYQPTANTYLTFKSADSDKGYIGFKTTFTDYPSPGQEHLGLVTRDNLDIRNETNGYIRLFTNTYQGEESSESVRISDDAMRLYFSKLEINNILYTWPVSPTTTEQYANKFLKFQDAPSIPLTGPVSCILEWADAVTRIGADYDNEGEWLTGDVDIQGGTGISVYSGTGNSIVISNIATSVQNSTITLQGSNGISINPTSFTLNQETPSTITFTGPTVNDSTITLQGNNGISINPTSFTLNQAGASTITFTGPTLPAVYDSTITLTAGSGISFGGDLASGGTTASFTLNRSSAGSLTINSNAVGVSYSEENSGTGTREMLFIDETTNGTTLSTVKSSAYIKATGAGTLTAVAFVETSSRKYKENISSLGSQLENIKKLNPVSYNRKSTNTKELGLIAEEVNEVYPEFVMSDGVNYTKMVSVLISGINELREKIEKQEQKIISQQIEIESLKANK